MQITDRYLCQHVVWFRLVQFISGAADLYNAVAEKPCIWVESPAWDLVKGKHDNDNAAEKDVNCTVWFFETVRFDVHELRSNIAYGSAVGFESFILGRGFVVKDTFIGDHEGTKDQV